MMVTEIGIESMHLELTINDQSVVNFLKRFEEPERSEKAKDALKVGVVAIQSASPNLDTAVVESKFREVESSINTCLIEFRNDLKEKLEENFKPEIGIVPRSLESIFGSEGKISQVFDQYFSLENGKVSLLLERQIGAGSSFAQSLDPNHKEGVICLIEEAVKNQLQQKATEIVNQFSLDIPDSALNKLKTSISNEINIMKENNQKFFDELRIALAVESGKQSEAERGTQKGRDFEENLYEYVAKTALELADTSDNVRAITGLIPYSKKGDYIIILGDTCGAPGAKIVVEAKKEQKYKLKDALEEIKEAKKNRGAIAGIFAFEKNCAPIEIGDFHRVGEDFFITVDEDALMNNKPLLFLQTAYKITRALIVTATRKEQNEELNVEMIESEINYLVESTKRFSDIITKVRTISNNSKTIEETANAMQSEMEKRLNSILALVRKATATQTGAT